MRRRAPVPPQASGLGRLRVRQRVTLGSGAYRACPVGGGRWGSYRPSCVAALSSHASWMRTYVPTVASERCRVWWAIARSDAPRRWAKVTNPARKRVGAVGRWVETGTSDRGLLLGATLDEDEDDRLGEHGGAWCVRVEAWWSRWRCDRHVVAAVGGPGRMAAVVDTMSRDLGAPVPRYRRCGSAGRPGGQQPAPGDQVDQRPAAQRGERAAGVGQP